MAQCLSGQSANGIDDVIKTNQLGCHHPARRVSAEKEGRGETDVNVRMLVTSLLKKDMEVSSECVVARRGITDIKADCQLLTEEHVQVSL
jgi:hypothetical protein